MVLVLVFYVAPAILTVVMAFTSLDAGFHWDFNGLANFLRMFKDPNTAVIIRNTVLFVIVTIAGIIVLDLFFAIVTTYFIRSEKWSSIFKAVLMVPMITPAVVYSVLWIWLLDASDRGLANQLYMSATGDSPINWIAKYPFQTVVLATLLTGIAYGTIIFSSAIKSIPENQFKAARVDGAGEWEIVKSIILPNLRYHITFILLWETLGLLTDYIVILLITNGGPGIQTEVWALSAYHKAFVNQQYGYGAAISLVLIVVVFALMMMTMLVSRKQRQSRKEVAGDEEGR